jgi:hypothetical protein
MNQEKYIGMDVHQAAISVAVMDGRGKLIMECRQRLSPPLAGNFPSLRASLHNTNQRFRATLFQPHPC